MLSKVCSASARHDISVAGSLWAAACIPERRAGMSGAPDDSMATEMEKNAASSEEPVKDMGRCRFSLVLQLFAELGIGWFQSVWPLYVGTGGRPRWVETSIMGWARQRGRVYT